MWRVCESFVTVTLDFKFRLMLCSREDILCNNFAHNMLVDI